jgi:hypothetical protein
MVVRLPYFGTSISGATPAHDQVYSLNSVYDPDVTGAGRQPRAFDQWAAMYSKYRVLAATVEATFSPALSVGATVASFDVGLVPTTGAYASAFVMADVPLELPRATMRAVSEYGGPVTIRQTFLPWQILGITKEQYMADDRYSAAISADPAVVAVVHQWSQSLTGLNDSIAKSARILYTVQFESRIVIGTS